MPSDTGLRAIHAIAPNVLDRPFHATAPNRKWITDFTYTWTKEGWLYVAVVIDLFSRHVIGRSMSATMTAQMAADALIMAIWRRGKPDALLHHSDRGSQYTSEQFRRLMQNNDVTCSMSRSGNVWEFGAVCVSGSNDPVNHSKAKNTAMESFFSTFKTERTARKNYQTRNQG